MNCLPATGYAPLRATARLAFVLSALVAGLAGCASESESGASTDAEEDPLTARRPCDTGLFWWAHTSRQVYIEPYRGDGRPFTGVRVFVGQEISVMVPGAGWTPTTLPAGVRFVDRAVARPSSGPVTTLRFVAVGSGSPETQSTVYEPMLLTRPLVAGESSTLQRQELSVHVNPAPSGITSCTLGGPPTCDANGANKVCVPITSSPGSAGICGPGLCTELAI